MNDLIAIFEDKIESHILDRYGSNFEEGWSQNVEFEFETQEYNCYFVGSFYVKRYYYNSGDYWHQSEESAVIEVTGEVSYVTKDFDDENEKTEYVNFEIAY